MTYLNKAMTYLNKAVFIQLPSVFNVIIALLLAQEGPFAYNVASKRRRKSLIAVNACQFPAKNTDALWVTIYSIIHKKIKA